MGAQTGRSCQSCADVIGLKEIGLVRAGRVSGHKSSKRVHAGEPFQVTGSSNQRGLRGLLLSRYIQRCFRRCSRLDPIASAMIAVTKLLILTPSCSACAVSFE